MSANVLECLDNPNDSYFSGAAKPSNPNNCYAQIWPNIMTGDSMLYYETPKNNIVGIVKGGNCCVESKGIQGQCQQGN